MLDFSAENGCRTAGSCGGSVHPHRIPTIGHTTETYLSVGLGGYKIRKPASEALSFLPRQNPSCAVCILSVNFTSHVHFTAFRTTADPEAADHARWRSVAVLRSPSH